MGWLGFRDLTSPLFPSSVKISMCSYGIKCWPGYRDLGFCDRDLGNRDENFPINTQARVTGSKLF